ncbi:MAG: hypothetical protein GX155_11905 [Smithella sp.]|nr:hypothetical protein [Smithella sp.]
MLKKLLLHLLLCLSLTTVGFAADDPPVLSLETFMATHRAEILKLDREEALRSYFATHLLGAYGDVANLVGFTDTLTQGTYLKEIDYLLKEKILEVRIDARTLKSVDKIRGHLTRIRQAQPLTVNINEAMNRIGYGVTAATLASQAYQAFQGDDAAKRASMATAINAEMGWLVGKIGSTSLNVSMAGVQFMDYALKQFITTQYDQYNAFWWNAYIAYHQRQHGALVTGSGSWAALIENKGPEAVRQRLNSFWQDPLENAAIHYKTPSPFQRDALAVATMQDVFAGRYYDDYLKTTLETYFRRKAEEAYQTHLQAAEAAYRQLVPFVEEMRVIRILINSAREEMAREAAKPPLPDMEIIRVTIGGYYAKPFHPPAQNGDDLHFTAKVVYPPGEVVAGVLCWHIEDAQAVMLNTPTRREVQHAGETHGYGYRPRLQALPDGNYKVVITFHPADNPTRTRRAEYALEFRQRVKIDQVITTDDLQQRIPKTSFGPDDQIHCYTIYTLGRGITQARVTMTIKDPATGTILHTANGQAVSDGREAFRFSSQHSLAAASLAGASEWVFEVTIEAPDGRTDAQATRFTVAHHQLRLRVPAEIRSGNWAEFSIEPPPTFVTPYTINIQPSGGLHVGHTPGSLHGTVGAISQTAATGRLRVRVTDAANRTAEISATITIVPGHVAPSTTTNLSGEWTLYTTSQQGRTTNYSITLQGDGSHYGGTIRLLGQHPYQWPADVDFDPVSQEVRYGLTLGTKPPYIQLRFVGRVGADGRTALGTFHREGGSGTAWSGTWKAVKR